MAIRPATVTAMRPRSHQYGSDQPVQHRLVLFRELHQLCGNTTEPGAGKTCLNPAMQADNGLGDRRQTQPGELTLLV